MLKRLKNRTESGDTIVEVLIVLAVLGLALSISYATANQSLLAARQAQENSYASELIQAQLETIRTLAPNAVVAPTMYQTANLFCTTGGNTIVPFGAAADPKNLTISPTGYPAGCGDISSLYYISIKYDGAGSNDTFTLTARWDDVRGEGQDSVTLNYRLHQP